MVNSHIYFGSCGILSVAKRQNEILNSQGEITLEETLTPDISISKSTCNIENKVYDLYCKRDTKKEAEIIKNDLIANKHDAIIRQIEVNGYTSYLV